MGDELRMEATIGDKFTGPLRALNNLLTMVGANPAAKNVTKDWQGVSTGINKVANDLKMNLQPALSSVGIASLGVGGAIGAAAMAIKNVSFNIDGLSRFSRQIGLSVGQLRQLKAVGERFGMDWGQSQNSLKSFASYMDQIQRNAPGVRAQLRNMGLGDLADQLVKAPNMGAAIDTAFAQLKNIQNPVRRRQIAQILFGSEEFATIASELTPKLLAEIRKMTAAITPEMETASRKFVDNWFKMEKAVDSFVVKVAGPALEPLTTLIDKLQQPIGDGIEKALKGITGAIESFNKGGWEGFKEGMLKLDRLLPGPVEFGVKATKPELETQLAMKERQQREAQDRGDLPAFRVLGNEIRMLRDALERLRREGATVQQQSFDGGGGGGGFAGLVQHAAFGGGGGGMGGRGMNPFGGGFWSGVYAGGMGGDPFRGSGPTWDRPSGGASQGGAGGGNVGASRAGAREGDASVTPAPPNFAGQPRLSPSRPVEHRLGLDRVDPRLQDIVKEATRYLPEGYSAKIISAFRAFTPRNPGSRHGRGQAMDLQIYDAEGKALGNYQDPAAFRTYEQLAQAAKKIQTQKYPELNKDFAWGGYFSGPRGKYGALDTMHFSIGERMGGGSWLGGLTGPQRGLWPGAQSIGMGSIDAFRLPTPGDPRLGSPNLWPSGTSGAGRPFGADPVELERRRVASEGAHRSGDTMMGRAFGPGGVAHGAPKLDASGSVSIHLSGGLEKAPARVSMDGLFKNVDVVRKPKLTAQEPHSEEI